MSLLQRNRRVGTRFGGGFVASIDGLTGGTQGGRPVDWFYFVNGVLAPEGAAATNVHPGDHIWWDRRDWSQTNTVAAVVGSYPEPFLNGLGGKLNGIPRQTGYDITVASEVMAILGLATSLKDLRGRLGRITFAYNTSGKPLTADDIGAGGAMTVLLKDAIKPNLMQTLEGNASLIHAGPFANIAQGNNSIIADKVAMKLADYVVTESGFGADLGSDKLMDIICRYVWFVPSCLVITCTRLAL